MAELSSAQISAPIDRPARSSPIVPRRSVAGRTLVLLIGIMTFLSAMTLGGVVLVQKSALAWSSDVGREVTIQIQPLADEVMDSNLRTAVALAEASPGVVGARIVSLEESRRLLEPWLGPGIDLSALAVPRLVIVQLGDGVDADLSGLERDIAAIKGATLETHAAWRHQLNTMAGTVVVSGILVLALIFIATALAVIFATRGTMASNREIVDVLHFIGATNRFIAGEFQEQFLWLGLRGGIFGCVAALLFFLAMAGGVGSIAPDAAASQLGFLFGRFALGPDGVLGIAALAPVLAALTAITSRLTVRRFLAETS